MLIDGKRFEFTEDAWNYINREPEKPIKKIRKNASKRKHLPTSIKTTIYKRSQLICEEVFCTNQAIPIHHIKSVRQYPELQFELSNLIHLCVSHHRQRHLDLPDSLFKE